MKTIDPSRLVPMDIFISDEPISIDIVYAQANHPQNIFKEAIYHDKARLWAEYDMVRIIILTARILHKKIGTTLELKDCLRTYDAQDAMQQTQIVKDNPHWAEGEFRLLAPSGEGAHPRGMAIDVCLLDPSGVRINMGTEFDEMTDQSARSYDGFSREILNNRQILKEAFLEAAKIIGKELLPLPSEWWDFRFPASTYDDYAPLHDADLPSQMRMTNLNGPDIADFTPTHFENLKSDILKSLN